MLAQRTLAKVTHHVWLDIGGEYFALWNALGDPYAEIPGAGADIGDNRSALQIQGFQNLFRLLPSVAFWVVKLFGPLVGIFEIYDETLRRMARPYDRPDGRPYPGVPLALRRASARASRRWSAAADHHNNGHNRHSHVFHFAPHLLGTLAAWLLDLNTAVTGRFIGSSFSPLTTSRYAVGSSRICVRDQPPLP